MDAQQPPQRPRYTAALFACAMFFFISVAGAKLAQNNFDFSSFILFGEVFTDEATTYASRASNTYGYDGQFYYRLAINPFTDKKTDYGITLDQPALRHQRIMYPLLVWAFSLGKIEAIPIMLLLVNLAALAGIIWLSIRMTEQSKQPAIWSLLSIASPAFLIALTRDLTELVAAFFLISGYILFKHKKHLSACLVFALAVLTRETTILIPLTISAYYFSTAVRSKQGKTLSTGLLYATPLIILFAWNFILYALWGEWPFALSSALNIGKPLDGMLYALSYVETASAKIRILEITAVVIAACLSVWHLKKSSVEQPIKYAMLLYLVLPFFYSRWVWADDWTLLRACMELFLCSSLVILYKQNVRPKKIYLSACVAVLGILVIKIFY